MHRLRKSAAGDWLVCPEARSAKWTEQSVPFAERPGHAVGPRPFAKRHAAAPPLSIFTPLLGTRHGSYNRLSRIGILVAALSLPGIQACHVFRPVRVPSIPPAAPSPAEDSVRQPGGADRPPKTGASEDPAPLSPPRVTSPAPEALPTPDVGVPTQPEPPPPPPASAKPVRTPAPPGPAAPPVITAPPAPPNPPAPAPPRLTELLDEDAAWKYNQEIDDRLARTNQLLHGIEKRNLSNDQMVVLDRVRSFVRQATEARTQDLATAHSLSGRGLLLAQDLDRATR